jgi:hypothetical protein
MRHWILGWAMTWGASVSEAVAAAATSPPAVAMNLRRWVVTLPSLRDRARHRYLASQVSDGRTGSGETSPVRTTGSSAGQRVVALLDAAGDVDGDAGDEVGVGQGEKADHARLICRLGDAAERCARDLASLLLGRALLPARADALRQRQAGNDGIDGDAVGPQLVT